MNPPSARWRWRPMAGCTALPAENAATCSCSIRCTGMCLPLGFLEGVSTVDGIAGSLASGRRLYRNGAGRAFVEVCAAEARVRECAADSEAGDSSRTWARRFPVRASRRWRSIARRDSDLRVDQAERLLLQLCDRRRHASLSTARSPNTTCRGRSSKSRKTSAGPSPIDADGNAYTSGEGGRLFQFSASAGQLRKLDITVPSVPGREPYNRVDAWAVGR